MNKIILALLCIICSTKLFATDFVTRWDMSKPGSNPNSISFVVGTTGVVNYTWETVPAGTSGSGTFTGNTATITGLPAGAIIRLHIDTANFRSMNTINFQNEERLIDVEQWGDVHWNNMYAMFYGCINLDISATDIPDLSNVTNMLIMFMNCSSLVGPQNINNWNTSNIQVMTQVFLGAQLFNQPLNNWNTSNVNQMNGLFQSSSFNQPIGNWNTSNVVTMSNMFLDNASFNQPINNWNTSNVESMAYMFQNATSFNQPINNWNTSNVESMERMFQNATSFNQPISNWNTSNVESMAYMFQNATSFNQPIGNWVLDTIVNMTYMLDYSGMNCVNYSSTLTGWNTNPSCPANKVLGVNGLQYGSNVQYYRNDLVNNKGWNIIGDNMNNSNCCFTLYNSINISSCNSYFFNGQNITLTGVYIDTFINASGCDSIVTINLTIYTPTSNAINLVACDTYYFNGQAITSSGTYLDTLINAGGCDSFLTLNIIIYPFSTNTINQTACVSYFFNGQTLTSSGVYYDTLINVNGCDSLLQLNLTINSQTTNTINQTTCNSYFFNGQTLTSTGVYFDTLMNAIGCDSLIILNLTVNNSSSNVLNQIACVSYFFNGQTLTSSGVYYDTLMNVNGCDSLITLNLTISTPNTSVTQAGANLTSNATSATYQWLSCPSYSPIVGETNQSFTATANGDYAVAVTVTGCTDTSACYTVIGIGIQEINNASSFSVYPNPVSNTLYIQSSTAFTDKKKEFYNAYGQLLFTTKSNEIDVSSFSKGIYYLKCEQHVVKVVVE